MYTFPAKTVDSKIIKIVPDLIDACNKQSVSGLCFSLINLSGCFKKIDIVKEMLNKKWHCSGRLQCSKRCSKNPLSHANPGGP